MRKALLLLALFALAAAPARSSAEIAAMRSKLPWIHDDYARAAAVAKARKQPIFVEAWAPW